MELSDKIFALVGVSAVFVLVVLVVNTDVLPN